MRNTFFTVGRIGVLTAVGIATLSLVPVMTSSARADSFNAKLGAWEMTFTTTTSGTLIPPDVLAKMSPDQRAKLEQSMKARASKPNTHVSNQCLTKEDLDQNRMIKDENDDEGVQCKIAVTSKSSSKLVIDKTCPAPRPSTAHMAFEAKTPDSIVGNIDMTQGGSGKVHVEIKGRWLGANCAAFNAD